MLKYYIKKYLGNRPLFFSFIRPQEAYLMHKYSRYLKPPILDFGCGDGFFSRSCFKKTLDFGVDLEDERRLRQAEKLNCYKKIIRYDGSVLPLPTCSVNSVISNSVFEHVPNINNSLKEIARILKPRGTLLTTVMTDKWEDYLVGRKLFGKRYLNFLRQKQKHYHLLSQNNWKKLFKGSGFRVIKEVGYLAKQNSQLLDLSHYLSAYSLVSYILLRKWVLLPKFWSNDLFVAKINEITKQNVPAAESASLFFYLQKNR